MELRELGEALGLAAVMATLLLGLQLIEWGTAVDPVEPPEVDSVEVPNPAELGLQGAGVRARRARALEVERRTPVERWDTE